MKRLLIVGLICLLALPALVQAQTDASVTLTEPTGPYAVGRTTLDVTDPARDDLFTDDPNDKRELALTVWYPADSSLDAEPAPWLDADLAAAVSGVLSTDVALFDQVHVHALSGAPMAAAHTAYPVLIMSHGGDSSHPVMYTSIAEDLASQGYIVVGIAHTYNAIVTVFSDGRVAPMQPTGSALYTPPGTGSTPFDQLQALWTQCRFVLDLTTGDALFVLDQLAQINTDHPLLAGHLDLDRVGMFGHSFGGATTVEVMSLDSRIQAGAVLDGSLWGFYDSGVANPLLFFGEETNVINQPMADVSDAQLAAAQITREQFDTVVRPQMDATYTAYVNSPTAYMAVIAGTEHLNFGDSGLLVPVFPTMNEDLGPIDPAYALRIVDDYLIAFFGTYLNDEPSPLLTDPAPYPEVTFDFHLPS